MVNPEHLKIVLKGSEAVSKWRKEHPLETFDLEKANLQNAILPSIDLSEAFFYEADLSGANLSGVNLSNAKLFAADLSNSDLSNSDLNYANLSDANLSGADLTDAELVGANLSNANLSNAKLTDAELVGANLTNADLTNADLRGVQLGLTFFDETTLDGANFGGALLSGTILVHLDLSKVVGLKSTTHSGASSVGVDSMIESFRSAGNRFTPELMIFFLYTGVPRELLNSIPQIVNEVKYCSTFIAYGQPDIDFATKLRSDLIAKGVSCWLYATDRTAGKRTQEEIGREREEAEKMIVLCSVKGLVKDGLLKEIEEQEDKNPDKLIPVSLDNLWKEKGFRVMRADRDLKPFLIERNWVDFIEDSTYEHSFSELLRGLRRQIVGKKG